MDMLISDLHGKNFLGLDVYSYMYFQISFLIFHIPFILHPLRPLLVTLIPVYLLQWWYTHLQIPCFCYLLLFLYPTCLFFWSYCSIIWDGRYFSFSMALCDTFFCLPEWQMKLPWHIQEGGERCLDNEMVHRFYLYSSLLIRCPSC